MSIDWSLFSPSTALAGAAIIGLAATMFALVNGRVTGMGGIAGGLTRPASVDTTWRVAFAAAMVAGMLLCEWLEQVRMSSAPDPKSLRQAGENDAHLSPALRSAVVHLFVPACRSG